MIKNYRYDDNTKLSEHFKVSEFRCKCGKMHEILIDSDLVELLEKVRKKLNSSSCNIYSGHRCRDYNKKVGGSLTSPHVDGYAVDCSFLDRNGKRIPSSQVCLTLEDLGHSYGIGYRCGGSLDSTGNTHVDVKKRKWYGDESKSMSASCCASFYQYFGFHPVTYQVYDLVKKCWLNKIVLGKGVGILSYAGNLGHPMGGLKIDVLSYRVHFLDLNYWSEWVTGSLCFAGNLENRIDGIQVKNCIYQVHLKNGVWLGKIAKVDDTPLGYAGIYGKEIDALKLFATF